MITNTIKKIILNLKIVNGLGHELVELEVPNLTEPIMEIIKNQHLISSYEKFKLSSTNLMSGIKVGELKIKGVSKSHLGGVLNLNDEKVLAVNITSKEPKFQKTIEISHSIKNLEIEKTQYFTKGFSVWKNCLEYQISHPHHYPIYFSVTGGGLLDIMRYSTLFAFIRGCEDFYIEYQSSGQKLIPLQHGETILQHAIKNTKFSNQEVLDKCVDVQQVLSDLSKITEEFNCNELLWNLIKPLLLTNLDLINDSLEFKTGTFQLNKTNDHINLKSFLKNYEPTINNMKGNFDGLIYSLEITIND